MDATYQNQNIDPIPEADQLNATDRQPDQVEKANKNKQWFLYGGIAVVVVLLVIGISFYVNQLQSTTLPAEAVKPTPKVIVSPTQIPVPTLSALDDVQTLESEIKATDLDGLDQEVNQIDQEAQGL